MSNPISDVVMAHIRHAVATTYPEAHYATSWQDAIEHRRLLLAEVDRLRAELLARVDAVAAIDDDVEFRVEHGPLDPGTAAMIAAATNHVSTEPEIHAGSEDDVPLSRPWRDVRAELKARRPWDFDDDLPPGDVVVESIAAAPGVRASFVPDRTVAYGATEDDALRALWDELGLPVPCVCGDSVHSAVGTCPTLNSSDYPMCPMRKADPGA